MKENFLLNSCEFEKNLVHGVLMTIHLLQTNVINKDKNIIYVISEN